jgi:hypothetical protein
MRRVRLFLDARRLCSAVEVNSSFTSGGKAGKGAGCYSREAGSPEGVMGAACEVLVEMDVRRGIGGNRREASSPCREICGRRKMSSKERQTTRGARGER